MESADGGIVVKLSVQNAGFWVSGGTEEVKKMKTTGDPIRIILTVSDPDTLYDQAIDAGALEIFPVGEEYGWRLGRLQDPFGHHWEIGHPISS